MQATKQITVCLFILSWSIARCYPTKPLNERSTELTWQAWLLIDESQNKQQDSTLKRRITPKSVFIAPTFTPENLPECSEGYQSDPMGRCIKIIMLNKELHLDFLLQQLNQKFGGMADYEYEEATSGPLNINIPLNAVQEETDVAIVVAPTKNIGQTAMEVEMNINKTLSEEKVNVADIAGILGLKQATEVETTTITESESTTQEFTTETTTANTQGTTPPELNALFFLDEKRQVEVKTDTTTITSTTLNTASTEDSTPIGTTEKHSLQDGDLTLYQMDQALPYSDSSVSFVDIKREAEKYPTDKDKTTLRPPTAFTVRSTLMVPKKQSNTIFEPPLPKVSTPSPFRLPSHQDSTTSSMVFTPIDNMLSMEDSTSAIPTAGSVFVSNFQNLSPEQEFGLKIKRYFPKLKETTTSTTTTRAPDSTVESQAVTDSVKIVFPTSISAYDAKKRVRFPTSSHHARLPTSSPSSSPDSTTYSSDISDRFGEHSRTTYSPNDQKETLQSISAVNLAHTVPTHFNLTTLYERLKAQRENHRNREKHSEWFHLPTNWSDAYNRTLIYRFSRKNGHMDTEELGPANFFRQFDARAFGFKPAIHR